jgi:translation initiation factor 3 subunit M
VRCFIFSPLDFISYHFSSISNLFNAIPWNSPLRLTVYQTLLQIATSKDELDVLELTKSDVEKWLSEWEVSEEDKASFLKSIVDAYIKAEQP